MTTLVKRCQPIQLIVCDVDGVLTDGGIVLDNEGIETKRFHIRDGLGIKLWQRGGGTFAIVTGRSSHIVNLRAAELGIKHLRQGTEEKLVATRELVAELGLQPEQACYIGDDLPDVAALKYVGLAVTVADACAEARQAAQLVTTLPGGGGAVREAIETILKNQRRWEDIIQQYER